MKRWLRSFVALTLICVTVQAAHAALIDHGDFISDTATRLDWLDTSRYQNISYFNVSRDPNLAPWRYATGEEFNTLVANWLGVAPITRFDGLHHPSSQASIVPLMNGTDFLLAYLEDSPISGVRYVATIQTLGPNHYFTAAHYGAHEIGDEHPTLGHLLVRNSIAVAAPPSVLLFCIGLTALRRARRLCAGR